MSGREPELDSALRSKLRALGEAVEAPLDGASERRIVEHVQREARRVARARRGRQLGGAFAAVAAAAAVAWWVAMPARVGPPAVARCAWHGARLSFAELADGTRALDLGPAGHVVLAQGAEARVVEGAGCALRVELVRGSLAADLGELRPGSLRVQTDLGDVLVRGTTFSVELDDALRVVLLSGAVELLDGDQLAAKLAPGKALQRDARRAPPTLGQVSAEDARRVSALLKGTQPAEPPSARAPEAAPGQEREPPASTPRAQEAPREPRSARSMDWLAEAEAARREGDLPRARAAYAQAQRAGGPDAEIALLRHAGFELDNAQPRAAEELLAEHRGRFPQSRLAAEAGFIHVRALKATGDRQAMQGAARQLMQRFPGTPQARAAQRLLEGP